MWHASQIALSRWTLFTACMLCFAFPQAAVSQFITLTAANLSDHLKDLEFQGNDKSYVVAEQLELPNSDQPTHWYARQFNFAMKGRLFIGSSDFALTAESINPSLALQTTISAFPIGSRSPLSGKNGQSVAPRPPSPTGNGDWGSPGNPGGAGTDGSPAGNITLIVQDLPSAPIAFDLSGQSGAPGGDGGSGGRGGDGAPGSMARSGLLTCKKPAGNGGAGGRGGDGGPFGVGGRPGKSGTLVVAVKNQAISESVIREKFVLTDSVAHGGANGKPGGGGSGGFGGLGGVAAGFCPPGKRGGDGQPGSQGEMPVSDKPPEAAPAHMVIVSD